MDVPCGSITEKPRERSSNECGEEATLSNWLRQPVRVNDPFVCLIAEIWVRQVDSRSWRISVCVRRRVFLYQKWVPPLICVPRLLPPRFLLCLRGILFAQTGCSTS